MPYFAMTLAWSAMATTMAIPQHATKKENCVHTIAIDAHTSTGIDTWDIHTIDPRTYTNSEFGTGMKRRYGGKPIT